MRSAKATGLLLAGTLLMFVSIASSQVATTSLKGTVYDAKGAAVTRATVTLQNSATGFSRSTKTDGQGGYEFLQIPPATYVLSATATGFATTRMNEIQLLVNTPATQNITLTVAAATEVVEVEGHAEMVNTQDASIGNAFESKQLLNLPSEGRDAVWILSLQPGVAYVGGKEVDQSYDSRGGSVNGARSDQTNVTLDGVDNNDANSGLAFQGALRTTLDSLQEFRVATSNSNADQGRSSGAQVSLITKSGTNHFHGSLYEYNRSNLGEANDWFNEQAQVRAGLPNVPGQLVRNTFGVTAGGPIIKDKLFFFAAYEGQRTHEALQVTRTVPSMLLRSGTLQYLDANGNLLQLTPQQFQSMDLLNIGASSAALQVLNQYPAPNNTSAGDGLNFVGYTFPAATPSTLNTYIVKLDANLTPHQNMYVRGNLQNDSLVEPTSTAAPQFPGQPANITNKANAKGLAVGHVWTIGNNIINNGRYGYVRPSTSLAGLQTQPVILFRGLDTPVGETETDIVLPPVHNFIDDVSWRKGNHTIQFGGNWRIVNDVRSSNAISFLGGETNPSWLYGSGFTCGACVPNGFNPTQIGLPAVGGTNSSDAVNFVQSYDLAVSTLAGIVSEGFSNYNRTKTGAVLGQGVPAARHFKSNEFETYLQDSWRVRPNLTLTLGARYTLLQPPYETSGTQVGPTTSIHDWFNQRATAMLQGQGYAPLLTFGLLGQANGKQPYWAWDYKNVAPRIAFAWSPGGSAKTSIRGGFGIYYDHYGEGIVNSFDKNGSFGLTTQLSNPAAVFSAGGGSGTAIAPRFMGLNTIPANPANCEANSSCFILPAPTGGFPQTPPSTLSTGGFAITWGMDNKIQTPYSEVIDFSLTHELPRGFVVEASYIGRLSHHLLQEEDLAMPEDLVDPASKTDYFTAMTMLSKAYNAQTQIGSLAKIPYWENLFPGAAGQLGFGPPSGGSANQGCAPGNSVTSSYTATQAVYDMVSCYVGNETSALELLDLPDYCLPSCSKLGPYAYFDSQFSSLYAWRSIGDAAYNGAQLTLRHKGHGMDFDVNYTYSKSIDVGSNAERINEFEGFGFASQIINSWSPKQLRAVSDFDTTHQLNANWVYELPFGSGKTFGSGMHGISQALLGGWNISGILRLTSGYPFSVGPGLGYWPTNWQLTSSAVTLKKPKTGVFTDPSGNPNVFQGDPTQIGSPGVYFRFAYPGESGQRNNLRGPGFFGLDGSLAKVWNITEHQTVRFSWETFNVTNTPRFDVGQLQFAGNNSMTSGPTFGEYGKTMTTPRIMQFALRYSF
ncbi:MAG TPA: carboxypeptidase-like regulatory domain-containing protein [Candidatus Sulfotelmatobacter sp.]|nr:carboxypeptidase-like regulatory domain-containing protein [Candidatus Sulfotelmatobacter sp.]